MPKYSVTSNEKLRTCSKTIQIVFYYVIKYFDNKIIFGHRASDLQFKLYKKGRIYEGGKWVIVNKSKVVTYKDGKDNLSKHNYSPSKAIDVTPYPIDFSDVDRIRYFAGFVVGISKLLKELGYIDKTLRWGGDWDRDTDLNDQIFDDLLHFEEAD